MNSPTHARGTGDGLRGFGANTKTDTPKRTTRQLAEDDEKALIRAWEQREKDMNAVLISAGAISLSVVWHIMNNIRSIGTTHQPVYYQRLYAVALALMSHTQRATSSSAAIPQDPLPSMLSQPDLGSELSSSRVLRMNMYWIATLVFTINTVILAMLSRRTTRDMKFGLIRQQRLDSQVSKSAAMPTRGSFDESVQGFPITMVIDSMYRLFQVGLVVFLFGHIDAIVYPMGVTGLASIVACGILYIFRANGPT